MWLVGVLDESDRSISSSFLCWVGMYVDARTGAEREKVEAHGGLVHRLQRPACVPRWFRCMSDQDHHQHPNPHTKRRKRAPDGDDGVEDGDVGAGAALPPHAAAGACLVGIVGVGRGNVGGSAACPESIQPRRVPNLLVTHRATPRNAPRRTTTRPSRPRPRPLPPPPQSPSRLCRTPPPPLGGRIQHQQPPHLHPLPLHRRHRCAAAGGWRSGRGGW